MHPSGEWVVEVPPSPYYPNNPPPPNTDLGQTLSNSLTILGTKQSTESKLAMAILLYRMFFYQTAIENFFI